MPRAKDPSGSTISKIVDPGKDVRGRVVGGKTLSPIETFAQTLRRVARVTPVERNAHPHHEPAGVTDAGRVAVHEHADRDLHPEKFLP